MKGVNDILKNSLSEKMKSAEANENKGVESSPFKTANDAVSNIRIAIEDAKLGTPSAIDSIGSELDAIERCLAGLRRFIL